MRLGWMWWVTMPSVALAADLNADGCEDAAFLANGACIHPTATIGSGSTLGPGARLGAAAALGPDVAVGAGAVLAPRVTIVGNGGGGAKSIGASTSVGRRTTIGADSTLGGANTVAADVVTGTHLVTESGAVVGYGAVLGDHVTLRSGATVGNLAQLGDWAEVGVGAQLGRAAQVADGGGAGPGVGLGARIDGDVGADVIVGAGVRVDPGARVSRGAALGGGATVGASARVGREAIVGFRATLEPGAVVRAGGTVLPGARVSTGDVVGRGATWSVDANQPPTPGTWRVLPALPRQGSNPLVCDATTAPADPNPSTLLTRTVAWRVNGAPYGGATSTTSFVGDTVPIAALTAGQSWTCRVTVDDGFGAVSSAESTSIVVLGPTIASQTFTVTVGTVPMVFRGVPNTSGEPGGAFEMGCKVGRDNTNGANCVGSNDWTDGEVVHPVTLTREIWVAETEVTQAQFKALTPGNTNPSYYDGDPGLNAGLTAPVETVSWHHAAWYANLVTAAHNAQYGTSLGSCYSCIGTYSTANGAAPDCAPVANLLSCTGYRLPTEAEWEWAARGGQSHAYSGSNTVGNVAWYDANGGGTTRLVRSKAANAYGLYDMSGNVWEWTTDWLNVASPAFGAGAVTDPTGPSSGTVRVIRGGTVSGPVRDVRTASRYFLDPIARARDFGFRLVRTSP
jgi:sulfatase modifying factor 1